MMKILVCGSRTITDREWIYALLDRAWKYYGEFTVVSGGCRGVDNIAEDWCRKRNVDNSIYLADWDQYGHAAGPYRNKQMVATLDPKTDLVLALWDRVSRGTKSTIDFAKARGVTTYVPKIGG